MAFNDHEALKAAIGLVSVALQSGNIKLSGPGTMLPNPGESDAKYLNELINALAENFKTK